MTATKRITRIGAIFLLVIFLVSSMATMAMASQKSGCCTTTSSKTYRIYKSFGKAIKITATQGGRVMQPGTSSDNGGVDYTVGWFAGRYEVTITYPNGTKDSFVWDGGSNTTKTLVGALKAKGTYTITISKVYSPLVLKHVWYDYGYYWRTYPQFTIKY